MGRREASAGKMAAGRRTYSYQVKAAKDGTKYLFIGEAQPAGNQRGFHPVLILEANLQAFKASFHKAVKFVSGHL